MTMEEPYMQQIYAEAESNANEFALACFGHVSSGGDGRPWTHGYNGRNM